MKWPTYIIIGLAALMLASCSGPTDKDRDKGRKSTGEIIKKYTRTLSSAPKSAQSTSEALDERNAAEIKAIEELE